MLDKKDTVIEREVIAGLGVEVKHDFIFIFVDFGETFQGALGIFITLSEAIFYHQLEIL